jgi:hypothetical protein
MPRRRSDGLTPRTTAATAAAFIVALAIGGLGCQAGSTDIGCTTQHQIVLPGTTPLPLWPQVRIDRLDGGFVLLGSDTTSVRWTVIDGGGHVGTEQVLALPAGALAAYYALSGATFPGDTIVVGVLGTAANGTDAELRFIAAPIDGSPAPAPGTPVVVFAGGADPRNALPMVAMGTSASAMFAGAAWLDPASGFPSYAFLDGQGQVMGQPQIIENEPASGYSCLGFSHGKQELTVSYEKGPLDPVTGPTWLIADVAAGGGVSTLKLNVAQPYGMMSCALTVLYDPTGGTNPSEYAIVWQDSSGSWLSIYYGPGAGVKSYPFASSTDFGGPDLQPPLMGLAAFGNDFGVLFERSHSVELWRVDRSGNRRAGSLVYPSLEGNVSGVASVSAANLLTTTYADLTGTGMGRRLVVDALCQ